MARQRSSRLKPSPGQRLLDFLKSIRLAAVAIVITIIAINHLGAINWFFDILGRSYIADANAVYLHKTKQEMAEIILTLASLDTGLEILKSSSAGVSFIVDVEVQVGNIVATIQEGVNKALMASLIAAGSIVTIELVKDLASLLAVPVLTLSVLVTGFHYITRNHFNRLANISGQLSELLLLTALMVHFGIPLAIYGNSLASTAVTAPIINETRQHFDATSKDFPSTSQEKLHGHVENVIKNYKKTSEDHHNKASLLSHSVVRHITALIFNAFIFPGFMLLLMVWISRVIIRHMLKVKEQIEHSTPKEVFLKKR